MLGSYILVKAGINESSELNFILDTGIRSTIITELQAGDSLSLVFYVERFVQGLGGNNPIYETFLLLASLGFIFGSIL